MLFGVCVEHEYDWIMFIANLRYGYSFKSENNCCSVYMNKTFYGLTSNVNGLLNLDRSDTHIHNIDAKRCIVDNDSATYSWHYHLGHIGVNRMKKLHADGLLESLDYETFDTCEPCIKLFIIK